MAITFHTRASLALRPPNLGRLELRSSSDVAGKLGITQHWTGAGGRLFKPDPVARLRGIQAEHMDARGYGDIAYDGAFDADGNTYGLRDGRFVGAHALSDGNVANRLTDGVVFLEDERGMTAAGLEAFTWWLNLWHWVARRPPALYAHEWWAYAGHGGTPTACPGKPMVDVVRFVHGNA